MFALFDQRHAERLLAVEDAAKHRQRCESAHAVLEGLMRQLAALGVAPPEPSTPLATSPQKSPPKGSVSTKKDATPVRDSTADSPKLRLADQAALRALRDGVAQVTDLLRAVGSHAKSASEAVAAQEGSVTAAIDKFATRFDRSQKDLIQAKELIAELQAKLGKAEAASGKRPNERDTRQQQQQQQPPPQQMPPRHRPPPTSPSGAGHRAEPGAATASRSSKAAIFESAEYKASAPSPSRKSGGSR